MPYNAFQRAKLPNGLRPTSRIEVAIKAHIFPEPSTFWSEFVLRHPYLKDQKEWFMANKRYEMPRRYRNADGSMGGPANCGICCSNWAGHPVVSHSMDRCPIPQGYRLIFLATNTPAFCPACFAKNDFHSNCSKPREECQACKGIGRPNRHHVPHSKLCSIFPGEELQKVNAVREEQYIYNVVKSGEQKGGFKVKLANDEPRGQYRPNRQLVGCPALNVRNGLYGRVKYADNATYPGLVSSYMTVERHDVNQLMESEFWKEYDRRLEKHEREKENQDDSGWNESQQRAQPGNLEADVVEVQELVTDARVTGQGTKPPSTGRKAWFTKIDNVKTLFRATKEDLQSYITSGGNKEGLAVQPESGHLEGNKEQHVMDLDLLAAIVQEWINNKAKLNEEKALNEMIIIIQSELTGQAETFSSLESENRFGKDIAQRSAYFEILIDLAMIAILGKKKPSFTLASKNTKDFSLLVNSTTINIPTSNIYTAIEEGVRFFNWLAWTVKVAQHLQLEE
ncbi:unnamed protein product [Caenorhabditis nigoni]